MTTTRPVLTIGELATLINNHSEHPLEEVATAIEQNGWIDDQMQTTGICHNDKERLIFNEHGIAIVVDND